MVKPKHALGGTYERTETKANRNMGKGAQADGVVHPLEPGITGKGMGRRGRRSRRK